LIVNPLFCDLIRISLFTKAPIELMETSVKTSRRKSLNVQSMSLTFKIEQEAVLTPPHPPGHGSPDHVITPFLPVADNDRVYFDPLEEPLQFGNVELQVGIGEEDQ